MTDSEKPIKDEKSDLVYEERHTQQGPGGGNPIAQWLPDVYEYQGKSKLSSEQAHKLVALRAHLRRHEDLIDGADILDDMIVEYLATMPSVDGESREQHVSVLTKGLSDVKGDGGLAQYLATLNPRGDDDE